MTKAPQRLTLLGATGSIGRSTLDVVARYRDRFEVVALAANRDWQGMVGLCRSFAPRFAVLRDPAAATLLASELRDSGLPTRVLQGERALIDIATLSEVDTVLAAIVGAAGLLPTLAAARAGKRILLANKETLVMAGAVFMDAVRVGNATLLPIDSEHNAIFQCLPKASFDSNLASELDSGIRRITLTASGGPFRSTPLEELVAITPDQACAHPKWVMGRKISVDSATMMNKGLELIEAHWLFGARRDQLEVVIHPESIVHSLVEYVDGSVLAQLGNPDMRTPIAQALAYPHRVDAGVASLNLASIGKLHFEAPDMDRFPCLGLAFAALEAGDSVPTLLNASNEVAVAAFLEGAIPYLAITEVCRETLERLPSTPLASLEDALAADAEARAVARQVTTTRTKARAVA